MHDLTIALVQSDQIWEDKTANIEKYDALLAETENVDIIVLPEMCTTGFTMRAEELAESFEDSPSLTWLKSLANKKNCAVYTSLIIHDGAYRNRGVFVEPSGVIHYYDKRKSFGLAGEDEVFQAGTSEKIVSFRGWKIQLQICYDLRFPEIVRNRIEDNHPAYDVILYTANWPERRSNHWKSLLVARAIENQCYVAAVNRIGKDGKGLHYSGDSRIVDPLGEVLIQSTAEEVMVAALSAEKINAVREQLPFLKDR